MPTPFRDELKALAHDLVGRGRFFVTVETMHYLIRGGRVSRLKGLLTNSLRQVPILSIGPEGEVVKLTTARKPKQFDVMWKLFLGEAKARHAYRFGHAFPLFAGVDRRAAADRVRLRQLAGDRFDDRPARSYFDDEFCRRILRPMTVRMNGAEPDEVFLGNLGSNIKTILDSYDQLSLGMKRVLDQFAETTAVRTGVSVQSLASVDGGKVEVSYSNGSGEVAAHVYDGVVVATTAHLTARIVAGASPALSELLAQVRYYPVALVLAKYRRPIFTPAMRALVFGEDEPLSNAGSYGVDDLDIVRYTFSGRSARELLDGRTGTEALLDLAEERLNRYVPVGRADREAFIGQRFEHGLCAYTSHVGRFRNALQNELRALPGVWLAGDYLRGASIEACFHAAEDAANAIAGRESQATV